MVAPHSIPYISGQVYWSDLPLSPINHPTVLRGTERLRRGKFRTMRSSQVLRHVHDLLAKPGVGGVAVVASVPDDGDRDRRELDGRLIDAQAQDWGDL